MEASNLRSLKGPASLRGRPVLLDFERRMGEAELRDARNFPRYIHVLRRCGDGDAHDENEWQGGLDATRKHVDEKVKELLEKMQKMTAEQGEKMQKMTAEQGKAQAAQVTAQVTEIKEQMAAQAASMDEKMVLGSSIRTEQHEIQVTLRTLIAMLHVQTSRDASERQLSMRDSPPGDRPSTSSGNVAEDAPKLSYEQLLEMGEENEKRMSERG